MSAPSAPSIPPRPVRAHKEQTNSSAARDIPQIPPRPTRRAERSTSPHRESYAPSPLNETAYGAHHGVYSSSHNASSSSLPQRPPSVNLPSIGQEGNEYANLDEPEPDSAQGSPTETRNVGSDVKLHAPKPGLPSSSAKAKIATVTRTDSSQAVAAGFGKVPADDKAPHSRPLSSKVSFTTHDAGSMERLGSTAPGEDEQGIPEIGLRVPMYPNAGDVQAPSPSPYAQTPYAPGIGFHNDGSQQQQLRPGRHHGRTRSGREHFQGPPGSYGLHGHGVPVQDRLERMWYEKHPEALVREEHGEYGPGIGGGRGEWALSSEDLNKLVRATASRGSDADAAAAAAAVFGAHPDEQIGYLASEEFASRLNSPHLQSTGIHHKAHSNHSQPTLESPLKRTSFPTDQLDRDQLDLSSNLHRVRSADVVDSEAEDDVIHVDHPSRRESRVGMYDASTEDLGFQGDTGDEEAGYSSEHGYGVPILAADEVAKREPGEFMVPAVSPHHEGRGNNYFTTADGENLSKQISHGSHGSSRAGSQPSSRPGSVHGGFSGLARFTSHEEREQVGTPLEDVEEYEPLFPENEKERDQKDTKKPLTAAERLKRPELAQHRFPSRDVWEDAPSSAQLHATVSTPDLIDDDAKTVTGEEAEDPESKAAAAAATAAKKQPDLGKGKAKPHFASHLREEMRRPGMKQRFPSRDIWEDTPASLQLQTTVGSSQDEIRSPPEMPERPGKPTIPARPGQKEAAAAGGDSSSTQTIPAHPAQRTRQVAPADVPAPPAKPTGPKSPTRRNVPPAFAPSSKADDSMNEPRSPEKAPGLPDRPKPQVPARPAKPVTRGSSEGVPLTKVGSATSGTSAGSGSEEKAAPPAPKPKPAVPARPNGGKLSGLKSGFITDLEKRIGLGPQGPKPAEKPTDEAEKEIEKEKIPLTDARKGRARGPARRKPAVSPSGGAEPKEQQASPLTILSPSRIWQIADDGRVDVSSSTDAQTLSRSSSSEVAQATNPATLATNDAGEPAQEVDQMVPSASTAAHTADQRTDESREKDELAARLPLSGDVSNSTEMGNQVPKASDDPPVSGLGVEGSSQAEAARADAGKEDPAYIANKAADLISNQERVQLSEDVSEETKYSDVTTPGRFMPGLESPDGVDDLATPVAEKLDPLEVQAGADEVAAASTKEN